MGKCYYCAKEFPRRELTRDHIPPRCFSEVYPEEFKKNRITVPCCKGCNNLLSKIESTVRNMIAVLKDGSDGNADFLEVGIKESMKGKVIIDAEKGVGFEYPYEHMEILYHKLHKGLFYDRFKFPVDSDFTSRVIQDYEGINNKHSEFTKFISHLGLMSGLEFKVSGHLEIFKYRMQMFKIENHQPVLLDDISEATVVLTEFDIHNGTLKGSAISIRRDSDLGKRFGKAPALEYDPNS